MTWLEPELATAVFMFTWALGWFALGAAAGRCPRNDRQG